MGQKSIVKCISAQGESSKNTIHLLERPYGGDRVRPRRTPVSWAKYDSDDESFLRRRDSGPGSRCEPQGLLDIAGFGIGWGECHVRSPNVSSRNLDGFPRSVMLFWQNVGLCRKSEPSAVMLLYDAGRQTDWGAEDRPSSF